MKNKLFALIVFSIFISLIPFSFAQTQSPNASLINITLSSPKYGASQVDRFPLVVNTSNASTCRYTFNPALNYSDITSPDNQFQTTNGFTHTIPEIILNLPEKEEKILYVLCRTTETGYENNGFPKNISLMIDRTAPVIVYKKANPEFAIEKIEVELIAETDDFSICRFDRVNPSQEEYFAFFENANISQFKKINKITLTSPTISDNSNYTYLVSCMNNAEKFSTIEQISFKINLSVQNEIVQVYPTGVIITKDTEVSVTTNRDSTCRYGDDYFNSFPQKNEKMHFIQEQNLQEKEHVYKVRCDFDQGSPAILQTEIRFFVSMTLPGKVSIQTASETCSNNSLNATLSLNNTQGIIGYYYQLTDSKNNTLVNKTFTNTSFISIENLNLTKGEKYLWEAWSIDYAGRNGTHAITTGTTILGDEVCKETGPLLNATSKLTEKGISISLSCTDKAGACKNTTYLVIGSSNSACSCGTCNYTLYAQPFFITENITLCFTGFNIKNLSAEKNLSFKYLNCGSNIAECCGSKKAQICDPDCRNMALECNIQLIDTDGDTIPDTKEEECGLNPNINDAEEDNDEDGISNKDECLGYKGYTSDPNKTDTDGDGVDDKTEIDKGSDPNDQADYPTDTDTDGDGIPNKVEIKCGLNPNLDDANNHNDEDKISNKDECLGYMGYTTDPNKTDTDGDGVDDKTEIDKGTDPNDSEDFPKSPILSILLFVLGIGIIGGGVYLFIKFKPISAPSSFSKQQGLNTNKNIMRDASKPFVNFNDTQKEMQGYANQQHAAALSPSKKEDLDYVLKRKKEQLKLRNMSTIFDEFAKEGLNVDEKKVQNFEKISETRSDERKKLFNKLEDMSKEDVFEEVESLSKKEKRKKNEN